MPTGPIRSCLHSIWRPDEVIDLPRNLISLRRNLISLSRELISLC